ncbi:MAG: hypothetical protein ACREVB_16960, partial [Burkholderiales bacterium]
MQEQHGANGIEVVEEVDIDPPDQGVPHRRGGHGHSLGNAGEDRQDAPEQSGRHQRGDARQQIGMPAMERRAGSIAISLG